MDDASLRVRVAARTADTAAKSAALREKWAREAKADWDASPITLPRLASEVWDAIKDEDWVLSAGTLEQWTRKLWDFDRPYRHPGRSLGTATQFGISLGVALAHRDEKRLVVDMQPDGDLMFDAGALWVAAKHRIPMLVVMYNNRAYYNDWEHQIRMAQPARHAGRAGAHRHGPRRPGARLCGDGEIDGLVRRGAARVTRRTGRRPATRDRAGQSGPAGTARHRDAEAVEGWRTHQRCRQSGRSG